MTPAWPVVRAAEDDVRVFDDPDAFESTTDERTMQERRRRRSKLHRRQKRDTTTDAGLLAQMRQFVDGFMASRGDSVGFIGARRVEEHDEAPVLRPRKGMRYSFTP